MTSGCKGLFVPIPTFPLENEAATAVVGAIVQVHPGWLLHVLELKELQEVGVPEQVVAVYDPTQCGSGVKSQEQPLFAWQELWS